MGFINFLVPSLDFTSNNFKEIKYIHYTLSYIKLKALTNNVRS